MNVENNVRRARDWLWECQWTADDALGVQGFTRPHLNWVTKQPLPGLSSNIQRCEGHNISQISTSSEFFLHRHYRDLQQTSVSIIYQMSSGLRILWGKLDQGHKDLGRDHKDDHYGDQRVIRNWATILTFQSTRFLLNISKLSWSSLLNFYCHLLKTELRYEFISWIGIIMLSSNYQTCGSLQCTVHCALCQ